MFNGIIFNKGIVKKILKRPKGINIFIKSNIRLSKNKKHIIFSSFQNLNRKYKKLKNTAKLAKDIITIYKR